MNEERQPACPKSDGEGKSRNSISLLECSEVLSSGKQPETFDFLLQSGEEEVEEPNIQQANDAEASPRPQDRDLSLP